MKKFLDKLRSLNWKRFTWRLSILITILGAIVSQFLAMYYPYDYPAIEPLKSMMVPVWFYAWIVGAIAAFIYYWLFVISWWIIAKSITWLFGGLFN